MKEHRNYTYVGWNQIRFEVGTTGKPILSTADLLDWLKDSGPGRSGMAAATYVVDTEGTLRMADRHSEHIACAGGEPVLGAGEIFFRVEGNQPEVCEITNQSAGYCPEPECWSAVQSSLEKAGIPHPGGFTTAYLFRRCTVCGTTNIIKDD